MEKISHVWKNVFFLGLVQGLNYLIPLILIPILLNLLGLKTFGTVSLAAGIMYILSSLVDFGFNITGVRMINQTEDREVLGESIYKIILSKALLLVPVFVLITILTLIIPLWRANIEVILSSYAIVLGYGIFNSWYLIGKERTATLSALNFFSRIIYLGSVLLFVKGPEDAYLVNICNGVGWIIVGLFTTFMIRKDHPFDTSRHLSSVLTLTRFSMENFSIFFSNFMSQTYRSVGIIIAGFILESNHLGIYGILDKIITLIVNLFLVISSAAYPRICFLASKSTKLVRSFYKELLPKVGVLVFLLSIAISFAGPALLPLLTPSIDLESIRVYLVILGLFPILMFINLPISLTLLSMDLKREYVIYNSFSIVLFITVGSVLGYMFAITGLLVGILVTEISIFLIGLTFLKTKKILVS